MSDKIKNYAADFETTVIEEDCRVWAWGLHEIGKPDNAFKYDSSIETFWINMFAMKTNVIVYFHNLKFDGQFIISYLMQNGYHYSDSVEEYGFSTIISDMGTFYKIKVYTDVTIDRKGKKKGKYIEFRDSLKKLPFTIESIGKSFFDKKDDLQKGDLDYKKYRERGHVITDEELDYLKRDVMILSKALLIQINQGLTKMTIGSDCMEEYKKIYGKSFFDTFFPTLSKEIDAFCRKSYKGGWTFLVKKFAQRLINKLLRVYDVNSLYPSQMDNPNNLYPVGIPKYYKGHFKDNIDDDYCLYIQRFDVIATIKEGFLPFIQLKNTLGYIGTEYLEEVGKIGEPVELTLTSIDYELFEKHYDIIYSEYIDGYKFHAVTGESLFGKYIKKWAKVKIENNDNPALRQLAKLFLNNLYGKFGKNPVMKNKIPEINEKGVIKYKIQKHDKISYNEKMIKVKEEVDYTESNKDSYIPVASYITSYARRVTITAAQKCHEEGIFIYADTDSIHIIDNGKEPAIDVDETKLGCWAFESAPIEGKYLRSKTYMELIETSKSKYDLYYNENPNRVRIVNDKYYLYDIKACGASDAIKAKINGTREFEIGKSFKGKLKPKLVRGGVILVEEEFSFKPKKGEEYLTDDPLYDIIDTGIVDDLLNT